MSEHEQIRRTLRDYCEYADTSRFREWAELFVDDGCFEAFGRRFEGRAQLEKFISRAPEGKHSFDDPRIEIDGERARVESPFRFVARDPQFHSRGVYRDELVRGAGGWRFVRRSVEFHARGPDAHDERST
jgi:hypothetical protein